VEGWRRLGEKLELETNDLYAFGKFADLEEALEPVEELVTEQAVAIDHEIQRQVDLARGK
jgi:hypothetical protein